ncbi:hypothetical protein ACET3Z_021879 [Daucus carota]
MLMVPEMKDMLEKHADEVESEEGTSSEGSESGGDDDEEETGDDGNDCDEDCQKTSSLKDRERSDDDKFDTDLEIEGGRTGNKENSVDDDDEDAEDDEDHELLHLPLTTLLESDAAPRILIKKPLLCVPQVGEYFGSVILASVSSDYRFLGLLLRCRTCAPNNILDLHWYIIIHPH